MSRLVVFALIPFACSLADTLPADSARGARLFESEQCIECHSVNGKGGHTAPDLGRALDRNFTPMTLASTMWNHAPTMWSAMRARNVQTAPMDDQAATDLFAYFYSARFFERPGDAGRGKRLFSERSCMRCHGIAESKIGQALPVAQWKSLGDPIALTSAMWNHSAIMQAELKRQGIKWPELTGQDLSDLLVYLRNLSATKNYVTSFQITGGDRGKELFATKGCVRCHTSDESPISAQLRGKTLTDVAAGMWDHGFRLPAATVPLEAAEMREVLSYVWAAQFFESSGDARRGKNVFAGKHCSACHDNATNGAPSLAHGPRKVSGITMVSALWRHGPTMLALMLEKKITWPRFDTREMSDLIAYLNTREANDYKQK
jgi:mono/diheme cytochrome c family protein